MFYSDWTMVGPTRGHPNGSEGPKCDCLYLLFYVVDRKCIEVFYGGEAIYRVSGINFYLFSKKAFD